MNIRNHLRPALGILITMTLLTGVVYPLTVTAVAQVIFPQQANGSLISADGAVVGSALLGQHFDDPAYFWGRPSATTPYPNNAASSAGSNLGPTSPELIGAVRDRIAALQSADPAQTAAIPVDLVTASGSGLDPHISVLGALYQVPRVSRARGVDEAIVRDLVQTYTEGRTFGLLGEPRVNVLRLNLALDERFPAATGGQ